MIRLLKVAEFDPLPPDSFQQLSETDSHYFWRISETLFCRDLQLFKNVEPIAVKLENTSGFL
jgi:hypothetical protein